MGVALVVAPVAPVVVVSGGEENDLLGDGDANENVPVLGGPFAPAVVPLALPPNIDEDDDAKELNSGEDTGLNLLDMMIMLFCERLYLS